MAELPEPWLRGPVAGVDPLIAPVLYAFQQAREDLARHTEGLTTEQVWARPHGFGPVGFHLRHIPGAASRLLIYLQGRQLDEKELAAIKTEMDPGASRDELLANLDRSLREAETIVRGIDPATLAQPRAIGRKQLPTTVIGILIHIAEHTQRHTGQAIAAAKLARVAPPSPAPRPF